MINCLSLSCHSPIWWVYWRVSENMDYPDFEHYGSFRICIKRIGADHSQFFLVSWTSPYLFKFYITKYSKGWHKSVELGGCLCILTLIAFDASITVGVSLCPEKFHKNNATTCFWQLTSIPWLLQPLYEHLIVHPARSIWSVWNTLTYVRNSHDRIAFPIVAENNNYGLSFWVLPPEIRSANVIRTSPDATST